MAGKKSRCDYSDTLCLEDRSRSIDQHLTNLRIVYIFSNWYIGVLTKLMSYFSTISPLVKKMLPYVSVQHKLKKVLIFKFAFSRSDHVKFIKKNIRTVMVSVVRRLLTPRFPICETPQVRHAENVEMATRGRPNFRNE